MKNVFENILHALVTHFKRIAEKYLLNVCRHNFAVNHIFYQDYVPYNERGGGGSLNQQKYFCPKLKYEGHLKKSGLLPKKKNSSFQDVTLHLNLEDRFRLY